MHQDGLLLIVALASALALVFGVAVAGKISPAGFGEFRLGVGRLWFGPGRLAPAARNLLALAVLGAEVLGTAALAVGAALAGRLLDEGGGRWLLAEAGIGPPV